MEQSNDTVVQTDNIATVTDAGTSFEDAQSETTSAVNEESVKAGPEFKDGKWWLDGKRFYTRDEVNIQASQLESRVKTDLLRDLEVDSFDQVKKVITDLRNVDHEGGESLNVQALKDTVKKKEASLEELQGQVKQLRTELLLKDHLGSLRQAMPNGWSSDQQNAVIDLLNARNMIAVENNTFAIKNGEEFLTKDGETPDYEAAVNLIGKSLGLPFGKKGVDVAYGESTPSDGPSTKKGIDESRLKSDPEYRRAYMQIRDYNKALSRSQISDSMIRKNMETNRKARSG